MSAEEDFQVLVSPEDYLRLQNKCQQLEGSQQKISNQNKTLTLNIYALKQQNVALQKNVSSLTDNIKYLSQKGIQMSKQLLTLQDQRNSLKIQMAQSEKQMAIKYKNSLQSQKELQAKLNQIICENARIKQEFQLKAASLQKILSIEKMSRHIQVGANQVDQASMTLLTCSQIDGFENKNKELEKNILQLKNNIKQFQDKVMLHTVEAQKLKQNLNLLGSKLQEQQNTNIQITKVSKQAQHKLAIALDDLHKLGDKLKTQSQQKQKLLKNIQQLNIQKKGLQQQTRKGSEHLDDIIKQYESVNQEKIQMQNKLEDQISKNNINLSTINELNTKVKGLENDKIKMQNIVEDMKKKQEQTIAFQTVEHNQLNAIKIKLQKSQQSNDKYLKSIQELKKQIQTHLKQLQHSKQQMLSMKKQMKSLSDTNSEKETNINLLQQQIQTQLNKNKQQENNTIIQFQQQINKLLQCQTLDKKMIAELQKKEQQLKLEISSYNQKYNVLNLKHQQKEIQVVKLTSEVSNLQEKMRKSVEQIEIKQQNYTQIVNQNSKNNQVIISLTQQIQQLSAHIQSLIKDIQNLNAKNCLLQSQIMDLCNEAENKNVVLAQYCQKVKCLQSQLIKMTQQYKKSQKQVQRLNKNINQQNLQDKVSKLDQQLDKAKQDIAIQQFKIVQMNEKNTNITLKKDKMQKQLKEQIEKLQQQVKEIKQTNESLQEEYQKIIFEYDQKLKMLSNSKSKSGNQKDQFKQLISSITDYFTEVGINLNQSKIEASDINALLGEQSHTLAIAIQQSIAPFLKDLNKMPHSKSLQ